MRENATSIVIVSDIYMSATAGHNSTFKQRMEIFQTDRLKRDDATLPKLVIVHPSGGEQDRNEEKDGRRARERRKERKRNSTHLPRKFNESFILRNVASH